MKTSNTNISNYVIEGYENDYVFQTIKKTNDFYEVGILNKWTPKFSEAKVIFDIGSNIGNHTLYWAEKLDYEEIYAFEPYKPTFERLRNNINNNNLKNINVINKGVGNISGFAHTSFIDETNMGLTTLEYSNKQDEDTMEIVDIDSFVCKNNIKNVDFIKIDVESFELLVLEGMSNLLRSMKPDLWIEVGTKTYKSIIDNLKEIDYVPVEIEGANILFLNKTRHENLREVEFGEILNKMFVYLEKTNTYYSNYLKCKEWLANKNIQLEKNIESYSKLKEKYDNSLEIYKHEKQNKQLLINEKQKLIGEKEGLIGEKQKLINEKKELVSIIEKCINDFDEEMLFLKENKALIKKLETQNNYLKHENAEYKRKLSLITDTKIGNMGIKCYKLLKKVKAKLK